MWWRALFAATVVTCTVTLAQGPQPLNQIKDVLCVLLLNSIQKEDFAAITRSLQNVNISENNTLPTDIRRIIELTTNKTDITNRNYIKDNEVKSSHDALLQSKERRENNRTDLNQSTESNLNYERIGNSIVENNLQDDEKINCDVVLDYKNGQPTLLSLLHFWRNCLNMNRPMENSNMEINLQNNSASVQNKSNSIGGQQNIVPTLHVDSEQTMKQRRTDIKRRYDKDATENQVTSKIKPEVHFLQIFYKNYLSSRRKSEESFKSNADTKFNHLNDDSSIEYTISHNESHATNNLVTKILSAPRKEPVSLIYSTEIAKESRCDNNLYYDKYEEHDNLNTKDFYNIEESPKVYKSGYGKIFYEYNETNVNALKNNPYQLKEMVRSLAKKPNNSFLENNNQFDGKKSELDIKFHEVLKLLENTAVNKLNLDNNILTREPVRRQFNTNNQTPTEILDLKDIDSTESTKGYINMLSTTNIPVVSVPNVHYANYLPLGNRTVNTSNTKYKFTQQRVTMLNNDNIQNEVVKSSETANSNIPKDIYFHPKNVPLKTVLNNQRIHPYHMDAVGRTYQSNLFEPIKEIKSTSLEVVSVSSIHYVNYLHPEKRINIVSASKEIDKISKLVPQFSKSYIYSREADEHNYYEYEKVNIIARNHNSHNFRSYYFYPEISQKLLRNEPRLPGIYFTPNVPEPGNGQIKEEAYARETQKQYNVLKNITQNVDVAYSRDGNMQNMDLDDAANLDKEHTVDTIPCTQKYANATDRRMNDDAKMNEPVMIDENKVLPKNVITNIAESIKTAILEDLRKELNIASSTSTTTTRSLPLIATTRGTPSVKIAETTTQIVSVTQKIMTQDIVLEKIIKYLEQMNNSKNGPQNRVSNFQFSNRNIKILDKDNEKLTTETYLRNLNKQKNYDNINRNNLAVSRHKKKAPVHKGIQRQKKYKLKDKIVEPKTLQTNELQIAPLGVYVDSFVSPINQNIVVLSHNINRGDNRNKNVNYYKPLQMKGIQNNHSPPKYRTNITPPTSNVRSGQKYINSYTNYDYQNNHMSEEHKDVKYLDDKFLNKVVKYSNAPKLPSNKDCCDREYLSQLMYECCNDKVVSRSLEPLINNEENDGGYRSFIQSQNKVNVMLARALASRSKFRSVESI